MATERVGDMTLEELRAFIKETVKQPIEKVRQLGSERNIEEVLASIDRHLWTPPPGTPSVVELIREDRDS